MLLQKSLLHLLMAFWINVSLITLSYADVQQVGIYGMPGIKNSGESALTDRNRTVVHAVFTPADDQTIKYYKDKGLSVFVAVNVFGGKGAWKKYPESRPVKADGSLLGSEPGYKGYGGVCPTHEGWRNERLDAIRSLIKEHPIIDGIWLDFIRYPGQWEHPHPVIPDTCYCDRCIQKFRKYAVANGLKIDLNSPIRQFANPSIKLSWLNFKKEQINSFVRNVRKVLDEESPTRKVLLGLFTVPWRKGDYDNAISFKLAQDLEQLSQLADVVSPMVYHQMVGKPAAWVGDVTRYAKSASYCEVWPIVQSVDLLPGDFRDVLKAAGDAEADGVLVYKYSGIDSNAKWKALSAFKRPENQIKINYPQITQINTDFNKAPSAQQQKTNLTGFTGSTGLGLGSENLQPAQRANIHRDVKDIQDSTQNKEADKLMANKPNKAVNKLLADKLISKNSTAQQLNSSTANDGYVSSEILVRDISEIPVKKGVVSRVRKGKAIGIKAGNDRGGVWGVELPACEPGAEYVFSGYFYRDIWRKREYPFISIWGQTFEMDTHWLADQWQPLRAYILCPADEPVADKLISQNSTAQQLNSQKHNLPQISQINTDYSKAASPQESKTTNHPQIAPIRLQQMTQISTDSNIMAPSARNQSPYTVYKSADEPIGQNSKAQQLTTNYPQIAPIRLQQMTQINTDSNIKAPTAQNRKPCVANPVLDVNNSSIRNPSIPELKNASIPQFVNSSIDGDRHRFCFYNPIQGETYWFADPRLIKIPKQNLTGSTGLTGSRPSAENLKPETLNLKPNQRANHPQISQINTDYDKAASPQNKEANKPMGENLTDQQLNSLTANNGAPAVSNSSIRNPSIPELPSFFTVGTFGANFDNLETIRGLGLNTGLIGGSAETVIKTAKKAYELGMNVMIAVPRDPDRLVVFLDQIESAVIKGRTQFYVNDEPGIHSFPVHKAEDIQALIKARFPWAPTGMAVVRPQVCRIYAESADFFMLDQYPVPFKPLTWLTDSLDRAALDVGRDRLMSIPQAFGKEKYRDIGWPREPTREEMAALGYLSVIHGSRAVYFFTFNEIGQTEEGRKKLGWAAGRLNHLQPWLVMPNLADMPEIRMVSEWCCDSGRKPAVHGCLKIKDGEIMLLTANAIGRWVEADLAVPGVGQGVWKDEFNGDTYAVVDGFIRLKYDPYQVRPLIIRRD